MKLRIELVPKPTQSYWIEADIPIPNASTIQGTVKENN